MAITAVAAGFFRRGVVVDIINWPVSLYFIHRGLTPRVEDRCLDLIGSCPACTNFRRYCKRLFPNTVAFFYRRGVLVTFPDS